MINPRGTPMRHEVKVASAGKLVKVDRVYFCVPNDGKTAEDLQTGDVPLKKSGDLESGVSVDVGITD